MMRKEKQNIGARIPQELLDELNALVSSTGKTKSDIINEVIAKYFGQTKIATIDRITTIENKLAQNNQTFDITPLNQRLDKLEDILQAILQALGDIKPEIKIVDKWRETISDGERYGGITQTELLEKYQLSYHALNFEAKEKGIPFHEVVKEKTGWYKKDPDKRRSRWLPLDNNVTTTIRELNGDIHSNGKEPTLASDINDEYRNVNDANA
ncbi:MAG: hypothetical protein ACR2LR_20965 [Hassallia sp.]